MRYSFALVSAFLAASAFAAPVKDKRAVVTVMETAVVTQYSATTEVVTAGAAATPVAPAPAADAVQVQDVAETPAANVVTVYATETQAYTKHWQWWSQGPASTSEAPAPAPTTSSTPTPEAATTTAPTVVTYTQTPEAAPTTEAASTTSAAPAATSSAASTGSSFSDECLSSHNQYRAKHQAADLTWNQTMADFAKTVSGTCVFKHSGGPYGENLAAGYDSPSAAITAWYDENTQYDYAAGQFSEATGHFTQLVWKAATQVGCATVTCDGSNNTPGDFLTCEYDTGNVIGYFVQNVLPETSSY